jgi:hypothetical protein
MFTQGSNSEAISIRQLFYSFFALSFVVSISLPVIPAGNKK